jgi:hypothetical protein
MAISCYAQNVFSFMSSSYHAKYSNMCIIHYCIFSHLTCDLVISFIQFFALDYHHVKIIFKNMPKYQPCHQNSACIVLLLYEIKIGN